MLRLRTLTLPKASRKLISSDVSILLARTKSSINAFSRRDDAGLCAAFVGSNQVVQTTTTAKMAMQNAMSRDGVFIVCTSNPEDKGNECGVQCRKVGKHSERLATLAGVPFL